VRVALERLFAEPDVALSGHDGSAVLKFPKATLGKYAARISRLTAIRIPRECGPPRLAARFFCGAAAARRARLSDTAERLRSDSELLTSSYLGERHPPV
jgi:hypothetical protein